MAEGGEAESTNTGGKQFPQPGTPRFPWFCSKPTVNILFYTDDIRINLDPDVVENEFGTRILRDLLVNADSELADFRVTLRNRHEAGQASEKLTPTLLAQFDQVWFFGGGYANTTTQTDNELTDPEVSALDDWMRAGGVLMTGDHCNPKPSNTDPGLDDLLGLGRAIGHRVPRAGALRRWEGGPPISGDDSYNTQVPTPEFRVEELELLEPQEDEWPQHLILKTFPLPGGGGPLDQTVGPYGRRVHRLFCGRTAPITVFPDHMHEGHLLIPETFPEDTWPAGPSGQPLPEVIAQGTDKRSGVIYDIVIAYDGEPAGVGRIVADSTWHHYFNVNLKGFPPEGYVLPQLAQFYVNLAVWLSPPAKRAQIACWLRWRLLHVATVQMAYRNSRFDLGRAGASVLRRLAGPCVIQDVFYPVLRAIPAGAFQPSPELMLGGVLDAHFEAFERADAGEDLGRDENTEALVVRGVRAAYDDFLAELDKGVSKARRGREVLEEQLQRDDHRKDG